MLIFSESLILFAYVLHPDQGEGLTPVRVPLFFAAVKQKEKTHAGRTLKMGRDHGAKVIARVFFLRTLAQFSGISPKKDPERARYGTHGIPWGLRGMRPLALLCASP